MAKEVKDRYGTVQIKSSLGRRLCPKSVALGIQRRVSIRSSLQSLSSWGRGQVEATARAQIIQRHSLWVMAKRVLCMEFIKCNKVFEDMECTSFSFSIIDKLGKENVLEKNQHYIIYTFTSRPVSQCVITFILDNFAKHDLHSMPMPSATAEELPSSFK